MYQKSINPICLGGSNSRRLTHMHLPPVQAIYPSGGRRRGRHTAYLVTNNLTQSHLKALLIDLVTLYPPHCLNRMEVHESCVIAYTTLCWGLDHHHKITSVIHNNPLQSNIMEFITPAIYTNTQGVLHEYHYWRGLRKKHLTSHVPLALLSSQLEYYYTIQKQNSTHSAIPAITL